MKRALGTLAMNWLQKPENQQRIKSTARDVWGRFKDRRNARAERGAQTPDRAPASSSQPSRSAPPRDSNDEPQ